MKTLHKTLITLLLLISGVVFSASADDSLLHGTVIGTRLSVDYSNGGVSSTTVNTASNAFDGDPNTFFASYDRSRTWVGLDLGEPHVITRVGWSPRNDGLGPGRTVLALFEGANTPDFMDAVPLYMNDEALPFGSMHYADVEVSRGFRYVRYVGPENARCNIGEIEFYGHPGEGDDSRFHQITNLPTVVIHTQNGVDPYDKEHDIVSTVTLIYADGRMIQEEPATSRLRGNASMQHPKKPYRIKFDEKQRIFKGSDLRSPAKAKKWTLINNYSDKTLMRNLVAFDLGRRIGYEYTPWSQPVDVVLNGEYRGCYQLTDQLTLDKDRIHITEMETTDISGEELTGGYLIELDGYASNETSWFTSICGNPITIKSPGEDEITPEQYAYIQDAFNLMETSILTTESGRPESSFRSHLDEKSLIQYFLTEEVTGNPDAFWSCYFTKERGCDTFHVGPIWDFDIAFDNDYRFFPCNEQGDYLSLARGGAGNSRAMLKRIFQDRAFNDSLSATWRRLRTEGLITPEYATGLIDSLARVLDQSQRLNFIRWPILSTTVQVNPRAAGSYEGEVQWLREFVQTRIPWIDERVGQGDAEDDTLTIEIGTTQQLIDFARQVNSGHTSIRARLTADIDLTAQPDLMIGTTATGYTGDFDGAGHSITIALRRSADYSALFMRLGGTVHDLTVRGSITTSAKYAAGIAGDVVAGRIERCQSLISISSSVNGDGTHGGIAGVTNNSTVIQDCLVAATMQGSSTSCCGGVVGWASGATRISNCLVTGRFTVSTSNSDLISRNAAEVTSRNNYVFLDWKAPMGNSGVTRINEQQLNGGEACFLLNEYETNRPHWFQNLGIDATPVPDRTHEIVYSTSRLHCDGTPYVSLQSYTNDVKRSNRDPHKLDEGFCAVCGMIDEENAPRDERGYYELSSLRHLQWFAQQVEEGRNDICGVLTADIDLTAAPDLMIGRSTPFCGTLDGAGHAVTLCQSRTSDRAGLILYLNGTLENLIARGSITSSAKFAGLVGQMNGGRVLRCQSYLDIHGTVSGDGTHGGLVGLVEEGSQIGLISDCLFAGRIHGDRLNSCGGLVGWASTMVLISDCLMIGEAQLNNDGCDMICRNPSNAITSNCYYLSPWQVNIPRNTQATTAVDVADGTLCYQLNRGVENGNQSWYQTLSEDAHPVPDSSHQAVYFYADHYTNESPDAIHGVMADQGKPSDALRIYDLSGRRITHPRKGIYVRGGLKRLL